MSEHNKQLIKEYVDLVLTDESQPLLESRDKNKKILLKDDSESDFGSPEHISELKEALKTLNSLKECFKRGTSVRMILQTASSKIKTILEKYEQSEDTP